MTWYNCYSYKHRCHGRGWLQRLLSQWACIHWLYLRRECLCSIPLTPYASEGRILSSLFTRPPFYFWIAIGLGHHNKVGSSQIHRFSPCCPWIKQETLAGIRMLKEASGRKHLVLTSCRQERRGWKNIIPELRSFKNRRKNFPSTFYYSTENLYTLTCGFQDEELNTGNRKQKVGYEFHDLGDFFANFSPLNDIYRGKMYFILRIANLERYQLFYRNWSFLFFCF